MGCGSSQLKQSKCKNCKGATAGSGSVSRSYSKLVHHPPSKEGDSYHVVALTSSTLGSLSLDHPSPAKPMPYYASFNGRLAQKVDRAGFEVDMREAKAWSRMIQDKLPKNRSPAPEPETINSWEMMAGLEEEEEKQVLSYPHPRINDVSPNDEISIDMPADVTESDNGDCPEDEFDTQVIKALHQLPPTNPFHLSKYPPNSNHNHNKEEEEEEEEELHLPYSDSPELNLSSKKHDPDSKEKLVLYFTSLRGIRKTYEDCCEVKLIFKGLGVRVDERDVSMHSAFKDELRELLPLPLRESHTLPRVFLDDRYIGGADDIRRMDDDGTLLNALSRCHFFVDHPASATCDACGDVRFVPCQTCSGSCKVYYEADEAEELVDEEEDEFGFQRCPDCNENGLIRCPFCCHS